MIQRRTFLAAAIGAAFRPALPAVATTAVPASGGFLIPADLWREAIQRVCVEPGTVLYPAEIGRVDGFRFIVSPLDQQP